MRYPFSRDEMIKKKRKNDVEKMVGSLYRSRTYIFSVTKESDYAINRYYWHNSAESRRSSFSSRDLVQNNLYIG